MNIETEEKYHMIIEETIKKMSEKVPIDTLKKIKTLWKKSLIQTFSNRRRSRPKPLPKQDPDSDDEYLTPECPDILISRLISFKKQKPFWKAKLKGCVLRFENQNEKIIPSITMNVKSDFFND